MSLDCKIKIFMATQKKNDIFDLNYLFYMAVSHKDWELPNSWIWLAEIDIDGSLDFPV